MSPYIHLNALRAGLVNDLAALKKYQWCGHVAVSTGGFDGILDREELLSHFGGNERTAFERYVKAMAEKAAECKTMNLSGGGMIRCCGGVSNALSALRAGEKVFSDQHGFH